jgi:hypothetical protein
MQPESDEIGEIVFARLLDRTVENRLVFQALTLLKSRVKLAEELH